MANSPEFDKFVKSVASFSSEIAYHSALSWAAIDFSESEPEIIRKYLLDNGVGVKYLNRHLAPILSNTSYEVKFASVFIHQKPRITRHTSSISQCKGDTPSCELGDLLIVFCFLDKNKKPIYKSGVIAQAKKSWELTSQSQQCLYDSDITFLMPARVYSKSPIPSPERNLPGFGQGRVKALQYLILETAANLVQIPWGYGIRYNWDILLTRILTSDIGLPFNYNNVTQPDWNCIMHDLLNVGNGKIPSSIERGNSFADIIDYFNDFNEYEKSSLEIEDEEGLPTFYIIVRDKEAEIK